MVRLLALVALVALGCNAGPLQTADATAWATQDNADLCSPPSNGADFCRGLMALGGPRGERSALSVQVGSCVAPVGSDFAVAPTSCDVAVTRDGRSYTLRLGLDTSAAEPETWRVTVRSVWRVEVPPTDLNPNRGTGYLRFATVFVPVR